MLFVNPPYRGLTANDAIGPGPVAPEKTNLVLRAVWEHRRIVASIAGESGAGLCDLATAIPYPERREDFPTLHHLDPVHFSEAGADAAGQFVASAIMDQRLLPSSTA